MNQSLELNLILVLAALNPYNASGSAFGVPRSRPDVVQSGTRDLSQG